MSELSFGRFSGLILRHNIDVIKREITLTGAISMKTLTKLDKQLKLLEIQDEPITIVINCPGGDVEAALAIIDRLRLSPCEIETIGTGIIMSAAIPILAAGDVRKATRFSQFMYHCASVALPYNRMPNAEAEIKYVKELNRITDSFLSERTSKPYSFWATAGKHVDHIFNAEKALEYGLINEIL